MSRRVGEWLRRAYAWSLRIFRWLTPGLGVKRWILLILFGTFLIGVGGAILVLDVYRQAPDTWWLPALSWLSLRFLDRTLRAVIRHTVKTAIIAAVRHRYAKVVNATAKAIY